MSQTSDFYFDHNSTTPPADGLYTFLKPLLTTEFGNPSSVSNELGRYSAEVLRVAREQLSVFLDARPGEIVFTSGGTESCFAALVGAVRARPERRHIVISAVEHAAVRQAAEFLRELCGVEVTEVGVDRNGELDLNAFRSALRDDTAVASFMAANNETGVLFPVEELARIAHEKRALLHVDAVQAAANLPLSFRESGIDLLSISAHKLGGLKGSGALFVRDGAPWSGVIVGGGQEQGRRGGTESVPLIAALGEAARIRQKQIREGAFDRLRIVRDFFEEMLIERIPEIAINGARTARLPNTSSVTFSGTLAEELIPVLASRGAVVSSGAACKTGSAEPSHVLRAMGLSTADCLATLRFSFGPHTTRETVLHLVDTLAETMAYFRAEAEHQLQANFRG